MQLEIKCIDKYKSLKQKPSNYIICSGTQKRKNHVYFYDPFSHCWTHGFKSYDGKGIVFYCPRTKRYEFSGVIIDSSIIGSRSFGRSPYAKSFLSFENRLQKGIETEKKIYENLKSIKSKYYVHHLERSGLKSHGTDIVISKQKDICENPFDTVCEGFCAIEVLGVRTRNKNLNPIFTYRYDKDFYIWRSELLENDILPVIAWNHDNKSYYAILSNDVLFNCFWIKRNDEYHQQTGNVPISRISKYSINVKQLYDCLKWHLKVNKILKDIENNRPISLSNLNLYSPSYKCRDPNIYDITIDKIKKYCF
jgi:hypothetical protein